MTAINCGSNEDLTDMMGIRYKAVCNSHSYYNLYLFIVSYFFNRILASLVVFNLKKELVNSGFSLTLMFISLRDME